MPCLGSKQIRQEHIMLSHHPPLEHGQDSIKLQVINCHPEDFNIGLKTRVKKAITKKQDSEEVATTTNLLTRLVGYAMSDGCLTACLTK